MRPMTVAVTAEYKVCGCRLRTLFKSSLAGPIQSVWLFGVQADGDRHNPQLAFHRKG